MTSKTNISVGLFKRFIALLIDCLIATSVASLLVWPLSDTFVEKPIIAQVITFFSICIYFGLFESNLFHKNTVGKSILNIKVVDSNGDQISVLKSFFRRFLVLFLFFNGTFGYFLSFENLHLTTFSHIVFFSILILCFSGIFIFSLFHPQKRGFHDIFFNTRVVDAKAETAHLGSFIPITKKPLVFCIFSIIICGVLTFKFFNILNTTGTKGTINNLSAVQEKIANENNCKNISVSWKEFSINGHRKSKWLNISIRISEEKYHDGIFKKEFINKSINIVNSSLDISEYDDIRFTFNRLKYYGLFSYSINNTDVYNFDGSLKDIDTNNSEKVRI